VLFTSDNGPTYDRLGGSDSEFFESSAGLRGFKGSVYEGGLRVPLVARWPGRIPAGSTCTQPAGFVDVFPTLASECGAATPSALDGESLATSLRDPNVASRTRPLYWELAGYGGQQAARVGDWKAVRRDMKKGNDALELYDLAADPGETRDLALERPEVLAQLRATFEREHVDSAVFPLTRK